MCALEVYCLTETSLSWIVSHSWFLKWYQAYVSQPGSTCCPDPRRRFPLSSHGSFKSPSLPSSPPFGVIGGGVRVPQMPHITPQLRPPVQPKASQHAASWPPVDAGRLNVTHIIIHHRGELGKDGRGRGSWCERGGGPGPDSFCPGQLKSLQPPSSGLIQHPPHPDQKPSTLPQQWWIKRKKKPAHALGVLKLH